MISLDQSWQVFKATLPSDVDAVTAMVMRQIFMAGFAAAVQSIARLPVEQVDSELGRAYLQVMRATRPICEHGNVGLCPACYVKSELRP